MMEAVFAVTPSETIKTKMIEDSKRAEPRFKGMVHGVKMIVKEEGYRGVYRGVGPVVSPANGLSTSIVLLGCLRSARIRTGLCEKSNRWAVYRDSGFFEFFLKTL